MAKKYVMAKWYKAKLDYNKEYNKNHKLVDFWVQPDIFDKFSEICKKLGKTKTQLIRDEIKELDKED